jgi:hypothetical protein
MKKPPGSIRGFSKESDQLSWVRQTGRVKAMVRVGFAFGFSDIGSGYGWLLLTDQRCSEIRRKPENIVFGFRHLLVNLAGGSSRHLGLSEKSLFLRK